MEQKPNETIDGCIEDMQKELRQFEKDHPEMVGRIATIYTSVRSMEEIYNNIVNCPEAMSEFLERTAEKHVQIRAVLPEYRQKLKESYIAKINKAIQRIFEPAYSC